MRLQRFLAADHTALQVDQQACRPFVVEFIAMESRVGGSRNLRIHTVVGQGDGIITRRCFLGGFVVFAFISIVFYIAAEREQQDVAQVRATRSVQMRLGETFDKVIIIIISRTVSPGADSGFGACLYQAERGASTRKRMSVVRISDKGINILAIVFFDIVFCLRCRAARTDHP